MKVYIYIDPEYNGSVWCSQTLKGLTGEAVKRHYGVYFNNWRTLGGGKP